MRCDASEIDVEDVNRSCGFLTKTERQYLLGEWDPHDNGGDYTESEAKKKGVDIKIRTRHALADLALLQQYADQELKNDIVQIDNDPEIFSQETLGYMERVVALSLDFLLDKETSQAVRAMLFGEQSLDQLFETVEQMIAMAESDE